MTIYDLKLHEKLEFEDEGRIYRVLRVPNGWIYQIFKDLLDFGMKLESTIFVPFHPEFKDPKRHCCGNTE
jgi:hypothetical protein